jgi:ribosomal protein S18 acetylase RimI-like enzyme
MLLEMFLHDERARQCTAFRLDVHSANEAAIRLYLQNGFVETGRNVSADGAACYVAMALQRPR